MRRREFIASLGGAAAWPLAARAQQTNPVIGVLRTGSVSESPSGFAGFLDALNRGGYVEGRNLTLELRSADGEYERLPDLAADLVRRQVALIFASGPIQSPLAAKSATGTIPIVFLSGIDPVRLGLVESLNRPGRNVTGVTFLANAMESKR